MGLNATAEADPHGRSAHEPGSKLDAGKTRAGLVINGFARALTAVAEIGTYGANKYTENGWMEVPDGISRYTDAMHRHFLREATGEQCDPDTNLLHAAHAAWNALARLELMQRAAEKQPATKPAKTGRDLYYEHVGEDRNTMPEWCELDLTEQADWIMKAKGADRKLTTSDEALARAHHAFFGLGARPSKEDLDAIVCGSGCACVTQCGDSYDYHGVPKPLEKETGRDFNIDLKNAHTLADFVNTSEPGISPIDALHKCIDRLAEYVPQWQPIETAPKNGTPLLLFARAKSATASIDMFGWHIEARGWIAQSICDQAIVDIVPSHWMERPAFPKERS